MSLSSLVSCFFLIEATFFMTVFLSTPSNQMLSSTAVFAEHALLIYCQEQKVT